MDYYCKNFTPENSSDNKRQKAGYEPWTSSKNNSTYKVALYLPNFKPQLSLSPISRRGGGQEMKKYTSCHSTDHNNVALNRIKSHFFQNKPHHNINLENINPSFLVPYKPSAFFIR